LVSEHVLRFLRLKPYETAFLSGSCSETEVSEQLYYLHFSNICHSYQINSRKYFPQIHFYQTLYVFLQFPCKGLPALEFSGCLMDVLAASGAPCPLSRPVQAGMRPANKASLSRGQYFFVAVPPGLVSGSERLLSGFLFAIDGQFIVQCISCGRMSKVSSR
jgi:hypothetical protein